jgi:hypothetical protein
MAGPKALALQANAVLKADEPAGIIVSGILGKVPNMTFDVRYDGVYLGCMPVSLD